MVESLDISGEVFRIVGSVSEEVYASGCISGDDLDVASATNKLFDIVTEDFSKVTRDEVLVVEYLNPEPSSPNDQWLR